MNAKKLSSAVTLTLLIGNLGAVAAQAAPAPNLPASANVQSSDSADIDDARDMRTLEAMPNAQRTSDLRAIAIARATAKQPSFRFLTIGQENQAYQHELEEKYHVEHSP